MKGQRLGLLRRSGIFCRSREMIDYKGKSDSIHLIPQNHRWLKRHNSSGIQLETISCFGISSKSWILIPDMKFPKPTQQEI